MDGVFTHILLWGREHSYRWFNPGMAPISGLTETPLSPLWHRLGRFLYRHGESFYHFDGLRANKEKFHPVWEARSLAYPGGLALPVLLAAISRRFRLAET